MLVARSEAGWYSNSIHTPGAISSNIVRNLLMNTGFRGMGRWPVLATRMVRLISGLDPSDSRITYSTTHFSFSYTRDEHDAGNPIHLLLGMMAVAPAFYRFKRDFRAGIYATCLICAFFLFCFQLKWQPWVTRLQLPMFVVLAPLFGLLMDRIRSTRIAGVVVGLLFAQSFVYLLYGAPRTLVGPRNIFNTSRSDQYFSKRPDLREGYQQATQIVGKEHPLFVGLACQGDSWEYALRAQLPAGTGLVPIGVDNQSSACALFAPPSEPDFIIQLDNSPIPPAYGQYRVIYHHAAVSVRSR
jgi:hypothetical protein